MRSPKHPRARGVTLIEMMIAMAILSVGLLSMWKMHILGITSTAAARRHTSAASIAGELAAGLERLPYDDALLSAAPASAAAPTPFGRLVDGGGNIATGSNVHVWSDSSAVPGVRLDTQVREMLDPTAAVTRRWTVWTVLSGTQESAKLVAASVTWMDPPFTRPREVVQYTFVPNPSVVRASLGTAP